MTLSPAQEIYCVERATGATVKAATGKAGVVERTGYNWNDNPEVLARIDAIQANIQQRVIQHFRAHAERAARRITECQEPGYNLGNAAAVNLRASELTLKHARYEPATKTQLSGDPENPAPLVVERVVFGKGE